MNQTSIFLTDKQIKFIKLYSFTHKISFNEAIRQAVQKLEQSERNVEIQKAKEG